jgi:hypothetical protein
LNHQRQGIFAIASRSNHFESRQGTQEIDKHRAHKMGIIYD